METFAHGAEDNFDHIILIEKVTAAQSISDIIGELHAHRDVYERLFSGDVDLDQTIGMLADIRQLIAEDKLVWAENAISSLPPVGGIPGKVLYFIDEAEKKGL